MAASPATLSRNPVAGGRSRNLTARRRTFLADLAGISPTLALYGAFIVIPTGFALFLSFTNWNVDGPIHWAGLANWREFFSDPVAHHSLIVTFELAAFSWLAQTPLAMALGIFVAGTQRYRAVYAAIYLVPLLLSTAGLSLMWEDVLFPQFGGLAWLGFHAHMHFLSRNWLGSQDLALYTIVVIIAWQFVPFHTLIFQAGRRAIPAELYDAASVDGASARQSFWHITLPQLSRYVQLAVLLGLIYVLQLFGEIFVATSGGPGTQTTTVPFYVYQTISQATDVGSSSAQGVLAVIFASILATLLLRLLTSTFRRSAT